MTTRRLLTAGALLALVSWVIILLRNSDSVAPTLQPSSAARSNQPTPDPAAPSVTLEAPPARELVEGQPSLVAPKPSELSTTDRPPLADALGAPTTPREAEAKIVFDILMAYYRYFRAFPVGENNPHFVNALLGANKHKLPFIPHDHPRINASGELVDAWGTPFAFHQNSRNSIEVRSAGADRKFYTTDDLVAGKPAEQFQDPTSE